MSQRERWKPSWYKQDDYYNLTYDLSYRTYASQVYPVQGSNGSSIVVTAHQRGLTALWRGGRRFKKQDSTKSKSQGSDDAIMIIDSDEEEPANVNEDNAFESDNDEDDAADNFPPVRYHLNIPFDTAVTSLAVAPVPSNVLDYDKTQIPSMFAERVVVLVGCADGSVRLVGFPLSPPSPYDKKQTRTQSYAPGVEELVIVKPHSAHKSPVRCVSLTWTSSETQSLPTSDEEDSVPSPEGGNGIRRMSGERNKKSWDLIVVSHSVDPLAILATSIVGLPSSSHISDATVQTLRPYYLGSPASHMSFNPCRYPARRHTHLLVAESGGAVRIYNPLSHKRATPSSKSSTGHNPPWLVTFHVPFHETHKSHDAMRRKHILDAEWAFAGKCILVLLGDGEWGIWDIWGVGPTASRALIQSNSALSASGISGGGTSPFALRGLVGNLSRPLSSRSESSKKDTGSSAKDIKQLAPMTPNTRKAKQQALFSSGAGSSSTTSSSTALTRGGISLAPVPVSIESTATDETLLLWLGTTVFCIPSLLTYWQRVANAGGQDKNTGTLYGPSVAELTALSVSGESINTVSQFRASIAATAYAGPRKLQHDIIVTGEHRLVILSTGKHESGTTEKKSDAVDALDEGNTGQTEPPLDQDLLSKGELDIGGVDRMLESMSRPAKPAFQPRGARLGGERRVGFATDY